MRDRLSLFGTGFAQVLFVAANTVFIARHDFALAFVTAFLISWVWSHNVRKVAFGNEADRITYAAGAACGCMAGMGLAVGLLG